MQASTYLSTVTGKLAGWHWGRLALRILGGLLLLAAALLMAAHLRQTTAASLGVQLRDNFYRTEQAATFDYTFARPRTGLLLPQPPPVPTQLVFRTLSPAPLPPRPLTVRYDTRPAFTVSVDSTPRVYRALLPPASQARYAGLYVGLETPEARAPGDVRPLGLQFDYIEARPLVQPNPLPLYGGVALLAAGVGGLLLALGSGLLLAGTVLLGLALLLLAGLPLFWGAGGLLAALLLAALVGWREPTQATLGWLRGRLAPLEEVLNSPSRCLLLALGLAYVGIIGWYAVANHNLFRTSNYDLGLYDQGLWLISQGIYPYSSGSGRHIIGNHAAVILYPLSLLYWLWSDVRLLLVFQVAVTALGTVPLYLIAQAHGYRAAGALVALVYLAHPATHNANLFDFHPDVLAAAALLYALWGIDRRRWIVVGVACLLMLACKEKFSLIVAWMGGWLLLHRQWRIGLLLSLGGVGWFLFSTQLLIPRLTGLEEGENIFLGRFSAYGDSFGDIFLTFLTRPDIVLGEVFAPINRDYLWRLLLPFAFLPLLSPRYLLLAAPALGVNLLSNFAPQKQLIFHYDALVLAFLAGATLHALIWLLERVPRQRLALAACALLLLGGWWHTQSRVYLRVADIHQELTPAPGQWYPDYVYYRRYVLSYIPSEASVSAFTYLQPHLSHRQYAYMFPNPFQHLLFYDPDGFPPVPLEYVVYDTRRPWMNYLPSERVGELLEALHERGLYTERVKAGGVLLLHRSDAPLPAGCFGPEWDAPHCHNSDS